MCPVHRLYNFPTYCTPVVVWVYLMFPPGDTGIQLQPRPNLKGIRRDKIHINYNIWIQTEKFQNLFLDGHANKVNHYR